MIQEIEFAPDSPLEGDGFELSVPRPASAKKAMTHLGEHRFDLGELAGFAPPDAAALSWLGFCRMLRRLCDAATAWAGQVGPAYSHLPGIRLS
jgi:hypothetical protein